MWWRQVASALVALVMLTAARPALAQGDDQQSFLAKVISKALSSPDGAVRIGAVEGALSSNALVRDIEVSDTEGPWLRVDRARLVWKRAALLLRRLEVEQLEIGRIEILRKPAPRPAAARGDGADKDEALLPELPVAVVVTAFSVGEVVLGEPVAGVGARLGITGNARLGAPSDGLQAALTARRLDRDGQSDLRLAFVPQGATLELALRHRESAGGLVAHLLDIEGRPAVDLDLSGAGPLDNWQGKLGFAAGQVAQASGRATILRQGAGRRYDLDLEGHIEGLLPPLAGAIFSGQTRLTGSMSVADDGAMVLSGLRLGSQQAEVSVSGSLSKERALDVRVAARALTPSGGRAPAIRALSLDVRATGPMTAPEVRGRLDADVGHLDAFAKAIGMPVKGAVKLGAEIAGTPTERVIDASFRLEATGFDPGQPNLASLIGGQFLASGNVRMRGQDVAVDAVTLKGKRIDTVLDATLSQTGGGIAGALKVSGKLDGRPLTGATRFASLGDGSFDVTALDLALARSSVRGALQFAASGRMTGAVSANLPDLAAFSALAGAPLRGAVTAEAQFSAPQGVQAAALKANGRNLAGFGVTAAAFEAEARLTGDLARPVGTFRAGVTGLQHPDAQRAGVPRLSVVSTGKLAGDHAMIDAGLDGGPSLKVKANGAVPFSAAGNLGLAVSGQVDDALANAKLSGGQRLTGRVTVDAKVRGAFARPAIEGAATLSNGSFVDLIQGTRLTGITGRVQGAGQMLRIEHFSGTTPGGGRISVSGTAQADPARGFPATLRITGENAQLIDNGVVDVVAALNLTISGALANAPLVAGDVRITSFDVAIPDRLPADAAPLAKARHLSPPEQTRARLEVLARENARSAARRKAAGGGPRLDVKVIAPSHIFVRGRGIDAELGGEVALAGPLGAPRATGAFELRRGQINMLTQRLEFSRGRLTFFGDLMPELDFVAATSAGGVTAKVSVTGHADAPVFQLSSEPQLPPDEVLSRLMFERAAGSLSALQAVQLAQAVARLSGHGGTDVVDKARQALGVDTLDVSAGKDGPTVGASRYIARGVRLGVKAGATPEQSGITANIDVGRRIKLQGETNAAGKASVGIGAEIDY